MDYKIEKHSISEWVGHNAYSWLVILPGRFTENRQWFKTKEDAEMWLLEMMLE